MILMQGCIFIHSLQHVNLILDPLNTFHNSLLAQVVMGGGQEAMEVTTTSTRIGKFEAR